MTLQAILQLGVYISGLDGEKTFSPSFQCRLQTFRMLTKRGDNNSRPTTTPKTDIIEVMAAITEYPVPLVEWFGKFSKLDGRIVLSVIQPNTLDTLIRVINFYSAQCFRLETNFTQDMTLRQFMLQIAPERIVVDGEEF